MQGHLIWCGWRGKKDWAEKVVQKVLGGLGSEGLVIIAIIIRDRRVGSYS